MKNFVFLEHTADVKFQAFGKNIEEVLTNSFLALKKAMLENKKIKKSKEREINVKGKDYESLLYNFLEEIIYLLDADNFVISELKELKIKGFKLNAKILGDNASNYDLKNKVKAVTYNEMFVKKEESPKKRWVCQVVLDV
jgi:SHS2 domain-containing protein